MHRRLFYVRPIKVISSYYTTVLSHHIDFISKYVPPFVLVTRMQMREMRQENRFFLLSSSFYFDTPGDRQFAF